MRWIALAALFVVAGCSTPLAQLRTQLAPRFSEETGCPEDQVVLKEGDHLISTTKVFADGCGKHATYVLVEGQWHKVREEGGYRR